MSHIDLDTVGIEDETWIAPLEVIRQMPKLKVLRMNKLWTYWNVLPPEMDKDLHGSIIVLGCWERLLEGGAALRVALDVVVESLRGIAPGAKSHWTHDRGREGYGASEVEGAVDGRLEWDGGAWKLE